MKMSAAMRAGAEMSEPTQTLLLWKNEDDEKVHACALGAIWLGNGGTYDPNEGNIYPKLRYLWPELTTTITDELNGGNTILEDAIWHRNDLFGWSREEIAAWLEGLGL